MDPGTALLIAGGLGAAGSIFGSLTGAEGAEDALNLQKNMGTKSILEQQRVNQLAQMAQEPYQDLGLTGATALQYLLTGQMPDVSPLTSEEMGTLQDLSGREQDLISRRNLLMSSTTGNRGNQRRYAGEIGQINDQLSRLAALKQRQRVASAAGSLQGGLQASPLYDWQKQEGQRAIDAAMASRGKLGSSVAVNALADYTGRLGAEERQRQIGDFMNLANIGRGAATQVGNVALSGGNALTNLQQGLAGNIGGLQQNLTQQRGSMWANIGSIPANLLATQQYTNALSGGGGYGGGGGYVASPNQFSNRFSLS